MNKQHILPVTATALLLLFWLLSSVLFIVYPWQSVMIIQFGEPLSIKKDPGLYVKTPWQDLVFFDSRVLTIDPEEPDRYITAEKENLLVDAYIKWRITDPQKYYETTLGVESTGVKRLLEVINRGLRDEIGKRTVKDVVTGEREEVMNIIRMRADEEASESFGIEIVDVRLKRVDLPLAVSENVYKNMIEERRRIANERRSTGEAEKEKIKAEADRERTIIIALAEQKSSILHGEGDAESTRIYADAYNRYREFYDFYRSLAAYEKTLGNSSDFFLLSPNSDYFRYLKDENGDN
ncbi:MAG: protease modulator HflC [Proteobacteria bacterium]|nr:protease modulator HflC [Pseudomonadota bacterium]